MNTRPASLSQLSHLSGPFILTHDHLSSHKLLHPPPFPPLGCWELWLFFLPCACNKWCKPFRYVRCLHRFSLWSLQRVTASREGRQAGASLLCHSVSPRLLAVDSWALAQLQWTAGTTENSLASQQHLLKVGDGVGRQLSTSGPVPSGPGNALDSGAGGALGAYPTCVLHTHEVFTVRTPRKALL